MRDSLDERRTVQTDPYSVVEESVVNIRPKNAYQPTKAGVRGAQGRQNIVINDSPYY